MSGKPSVWTPDRQEWLVNTVRSHVLAAGQVDWQRIATAGGVSVHGARMQYQELNRRGRAPLISLLLKEAVATKLGGPSPSAPAAEPEQKVETKTTDAGVESTAIGSRIKTVDDLLRHIGADLTRYEIDKFEATKWDGHSKDADGKAKVTELHRVWVRLKPKAGPTTLELVETIVAAAKLGRRPLAVSRPLGRASGGLLQLLNVADPHHGKYAHGKSTGWGDYDLGISCGLQREAGGYLLEQGDQRKPEHRIIAVLGDYFHYDTPRGTTTAGTVLDRDGRVHKMIGDGSAALFDLIHQSAETCPTEVVLVPGNHDEVLTAALQMILVSEFRRHKRVTIDATPHTRKYRKWGKVGLGFTHGDKAKPKLAALMAQEFGDWSETIYREFHTGHLHMQEAKGQEHIGTHGGVITRTAPSLAAADSWHYENGFVGSLRGMETFYYHTAGKFLGMDVASPMVKAPAIKRAA